MQEITKRAVEKLVKEEAHVLDVVDYDDIAELDKIAERVVNQTQSERRLLNQPFELCGIAFYPLTVAKSLWYAEKVRDWEIEGLFQDALLFWLLTLPLTEAAIDAYSTRKAADAAVLRLSRRLHCTQSEMAEVFRKCVGARETRGTSSSTQTEPDYGGLIACLLREYGGTPEQWLYETPVEQIGALIDQFVRKVNAENDAASASSQRGGKAIAPKPTAKMQALRDYRLKVNEIKKEWSTSNG